ncbi:HEPN domain-containing protein [Granulicella rosea]|uniref:HEPN domain-containing protein n=1 Tax=Granulicella rosea TaxID=474952 RepID=A0A239M6U5_9BACT|nr:HEPN domain-containing protein [Granulicella rosea]SNT38331.1 HEPN domain-containing protein [Granulicella rosea]
MIGSIQNQHAQMLCTLARDDESTLQYPLPDQIYGFHAQQSCEKLMKALLTAHGVAYPFTHILAVLIKELTVHNELLPVTSFDLKRLEPYAVQLRYDTSNRLSPDERTAIRDAVVLLREHIVTRILALESIP